MLKDMGIRDAFKKLGRKAKASEESKKDYKWKRNKQRERNRIEGFIGNVKAKKVLTSQFVITF